MSETPVSPPARERETANVPTAVPVAHDRMPAWLRKAALIAGSVLLIALVYLVLSIVLPRWWAETVGNQVDGVSSAGVLWGLLYGFVFTLIPLGVASMALRTGMSAKARLGVGVVALLLMAPNLLTLAIALGPSEVAQARRLTFEIEAPSFRGATAAGVGIALLVALVIGILVWRMAASRREIENLRGKVTSAAVTKPPKPSKPAVGAPAEAKPAASPPSANASPHEALHELPLEDQEGNK